MRSYNLGETIAQSHTEEGPTLFLAYTLRALADPKRLHILSLLTQGERCVCEIERALGLPQTLVSHHLGVLRRAGLVRARRDEGDGRWVYYSINKEALARFNEQYLALLDANRIGEGIACCDDGGNPLRSGSATAEQTPG